MKNKSKIKITNLSDKAKNSLLHPLSDAETTQIVGGCRWCPPPRPGRPGKESNSS